MKELVGHTILKIEMDGGGYVLQFTTEVGPLSFEVEGDCCSHSYYNDIIGVDNLLGGGTVVTVETLDLPAVDSGNDHNFIQAYGYQITTQRGTATIVFRNESNGCYGGYMRYRENYGLLKDPKEITTEYSR